MSCETHRQDALSRILAAHPGKGLTATDAERIYQAHKQKHPAVTYESVGELAHIVAQAGGALTLEEAQTVYDAAQAMNASSAPAANFNMTPARKPAAPKKPVADPAHQGDPLTEWIKQQGRTGIVGHEITERWQSRIVANNWHTDGEAGAEAYLKQYGKSIGAEKVSALARQAEREGYPDMARGFWKKAYELKTGQPAPTGKAVAYQPPTPAPLSSPPALAAVHPDAGAPVAHCLKCKKKQPVQDSQPAFLKNGTAISKGKCAHCGTTIHIFGRTPAHDALPQPTKPAQATPTPKPKPTPIAAKTSDVAVREHALLSLGRMASSHPEPIAPAGVDNYMAALSSEFSVLKKAYPGGQTEQNYRDYLRAGVPPSRLSITQGGSVTANVTGMQDYDCPNCGHHFWPRPPAQGHPKRCPACGAIPEQYAAELAGQSEAELRQAVELAQSAPATGRARSQLELARAEIAARGLPADTLERWAHGEDVLRDGPLMACLPDDQQAALRNEFGEEQLVRAIRKHLLAPAQKRTLDGLSLSIEDVLNGRVPAHETPTIDHILREWNVEAGEDLFTPLGGQLAVMTETIERGMDGPLTSLPAGAPAVLLDTAPVVTATPVVTARAAPRPLTVGRLAPKKAATPQEHILSAVRMPPPDPYRSQVPAELGGALDTPIHLNAFVPAVSRQYEVNDETEKALRTISIALQTGDPQLYNFYIGGKPGVGKNTLLRQVAASIQHTDAEGVTRQGIPYHQVDVVEQTNFDDLIGGTVLVQENGVTVTRWKPGPVGAFLMHGTGVLAINEIVRQPKAATLLQSIMEDRELPIRTPDGGMVKVPIGPGIIVAMTGNPGSDRDPDRPGAAAFTRTIPIRMEDGSTEERARRAEIAYLKRTGGKGAAEPKAKARPEIASRDYTIKNEPLQKDELNAAVGFLDEIEQLIEGRQVQARTGGGRPVTPGPRGLDRFIALGKGTGDWRAALDMLKLYCSQDRELFAEEWKLANAAFERKFVLNADGAWQGGRKVR